MLKCMHMLAAFVLALSTPRSTSESVHVDEYLRDIRMAKGQVSAVSSEGHSTRDTKPAVKVGPASMTVERPVLNEIEGPLLEASDEFAPPIQDPKPEDGDARHHLPAALPPVTGSELIDRLRANQLRLSGDIGGRFIPLRNASARVYDRTRLSA